MSGFIDPKLRILDTIITQEGKRQISAGKLKAEYYSFSDEGAYYKLDDTFASGSQDFLSRMHLEACSLPQDQITLEVDDSGKLIIPGIMTSGATNYKVINGQIFSGSIGQTLTAVTNSADFTTLSSNLISSSLTNFTRLRLIGSPDILDEQHNEFIVNPTNLQFTITDKSPIQTEENGGIQQASINNIESLFDDKRLSHIPNYQYLPPVNKPSIGSTTKSSLGVWGNLGQPPIVTYDDLRKEVDQYDQLGMTQTVYFTETSKTNRIFGQFFEVADSRITKLDVIDFGLFVIKNDEIKQLSEDDVKRAEDQGRSYVTTHVYFVGKLFLDDKGTHTFVNIFTLLLS